MKDAIRLFVAATLPEALKQELQEQLQVYNHPSVRPVPHQNLHLTLFFLGNVPVQQLPDIKQTIREVAQRHQPFVLDFGCTEPGPKPKSPRLIWARFAELLAFEQLSHDLAQALSAEPPKKQKAIPHVTVARFKKDKSVPNNLFTITAKEPLQLHVPAIALWQSELASPHPVYSVLETYPLG
ncbi:RNA 2',3'-cyclic phosphodiesterase [Pontibacter toksunensis]|uniref:RNA 2',3'-cyclic phosphodiesterase n=1 Tax=Pontibacter toksunensis TaxID=1332631 RepID=A0ABW6BZ79_9BACT